MLEKLEAKPRTSIAKEGQTNGVEMNQGLSGRGKREVLPPRKGKSFLYVLVGRFYRGGTIKTNTLPRKEGLTVAGGGL